MPNVILTDQEVSLITNAINMYWNDAQDQLLNGGAPMEIKRRPLGDIEKQLLEQRVVLLTPMFDKFENLE